MENNFGTKELYDVSINATFPIEIDGKIYDPGESILFFNNVTVASLNELTTQVSAKGGYNNVDQVTWRSTKSIQFSFTKGVISRLGLALTSNSELFTNNKPISVPKKEDVESNNAGIITLKYAPNSRLFLYDKNTGKRIIDYTVNGNEIDIKTPYLEVIANYNFDYNDLSKRINVGKRLINGYVSLTGKMRVKDDISGTPKTVVVEIPKLELASDLSLRLGEDTNPMVSSFYMIGHPVGERMEQYVCTMNFLSDDIDADF